MLANLLQSTRIVSCTSLTLGHPSPRPCAHSICICPGHRFDGVWHADQPRCGSYSEVLPAPPGSAGALPNVELADAAAVLREATAAAAASAAAAQAVAAAAALPVTEAM